MFMMMFNDLKSKFASGDWTMADAYDYIRSEAKALNPGKNVDDLINQLQTDKPEDLLDMLMTMARGGDDDKDGGSQMIDYIFETFNSRFTAATFNTEDASRWIINTIRDNLENDGRDPEQILNQLREVMP
jgi:hypothetical protein